VHEIVIAVQVNGKLRATLTCAPGETQQVLEPAARALVEKWLEQATAKKVVFVKDRLINFVI
jgi:leucyl-tRNA synthetase